MQRLEPKIIEVEGEHFIVHFKNEGSDDYKMRWSGVVAVIQMFSDKTWKYKSDKNSDHVDKLEDAEQWFQWTYCWRGVWEGRVYFINDQEFWCEEMETIPKIWDQIEEVVKGKIKSDNPDYGCFDD